jgi:hypothetical protein
MPVPPLPLELHRLILLHLANDLPHVERREHGGRVALVCKAWKPLGVELALRNLVLRREKDDKLAELLVEHPEWLSKVKNLILKGSPDFEDFGEAAGGAIWEDVLHLCSNLVTLAFDPFFQSNLMNTAAHSNSAAGLTELFAAVGYTGWNPLTIEQLSNSLSSFTSLSRLDLRIGNFSAGDPDDLLPSPQTPTTLLRLSELALTMTAPPNPPSITAVSNLLAAVLDPSTLADVQITE